MPSSGCFAKYASHVSSMQRRNRSTYRAAPSSSPARRECTKPTENVTDRSMGMNRRPLGLGFKKSLSESENVTAHPALHVLVDQRDVRGVHDDVLERMRREHLRQDGVQDGLVVARDGKAGHLGHRHGALARRKQILRAHHAHARPEQRHVLHVGVVQKAGEHAVRKADDGRGFRLASPRRGPRRCRAGSSPPAPRRAGRRRTVRPS